MSDALQQRCINLKLIMRIRMSIWRSAEKSLILSPADEVKKLKYFKIRNISPTFALVALLPRKGDCWLFLLRCLRLKGKFRKFNLTVFNCLHASFYSSLELWLRSLIHTERCCTQKCWIHVRFCLPYKPAALVDELYFICLDV